MDELTKLIERAQEGERDAFGKIYNLFYRRIFRFCKFNVAQETDAQDLCQETFLRAYRHLSTFSERKGGSFQAYLFKIARNLIIDARRKKKDVPLKDWHDVEKADDLGEEIDKEFRKQNLQEAIAKLPESERQIVILRYFEEMTTTEVAEVVGMREGALRVRSHRILKKLKELLEHV